MPRTYEQNKEIKSKRKEALLSSLYMLFLKYRYDDIDISLINTDDTQIVETVSELTADEYAKIGLEIAEQAKKKTEDIKKSNKSSNTYSNSNQNLDDVVIKLFKGAIK